MRLCKKISLEKCKYYFDWDLKGNLYWKVKTARCVQVGSLVGGRNEQGYFRVMINGKHYLQHRILYQLYHNIELENLLIDHIDKNTSNNSFENLRLCDNSENMCNQNARKDNLSTGIKNIYIRTYKHRNNRKVYTVQIQKGSERYTKDFDFNKFSLEDVIKYRDNELERMHGKFKNIDNKKGTEINQSL